MIQSETSILKIAVLGPESSGKTTLCRKLADCFNTLYAHEAVRGYLRRGRKISCKEDLYLAALKQIRIEKVRFRRARHFLFCDTELINLKVWSDELFGTCDQRLIDLIESHRYDLYLLTHPNIPWSQDKLRVGQNERGRLLEVYRNELIINKTPFMEVSLSGKLRSEGVENYLKSLI